MGFGHPVRARSFGLNEEVGFCLVQGVILSPVEEVQGSVDLVMATEILVTLGQLLPAVGGESCVCDTLDAQVVVVIEPVYDFLDGAISLSRSDRVHLCRGRSGLE